MAYPQDYNIHRPPHLYSDGEIYFITCRTVDKRDYFHGYENFIVSSLNLAKNKYPSKLFAWAILGNHYHLLLEVVKGRDIANIIRFINGRSAKLILNEMKRGSAPGSDTPSGRVTGVRNDTASPASSSEAGRAGGVIGGIGKTITCPEGVSLPGRHCVWEQYFDRCISTEKEFYTYFNYINLNPIKHGRVKNKKELLEYPFCSYRNCVDKFGQAAMDDIIAQYPVEAGEMMGD
ncbi:transposase [Candidatus Falkowbacteria bacterium]|nr:transposase [Candidatus Falkowbacteria bacterium]